MYQVSKEFYIAYAHRLLDYEGACKNLHGHNGKIILTIEGELNSQGFVIDFNDIISKIKKHIDETYDHACFVNINDFVLIKYLQNSEMKYVYFKNNTTAENIAYDIFLCTKIKLAEIDSELILKKVEFFETETSKAAYE